MCCRRFSEKRRAWREDDNPDKTSLLWEAMDDVMPTTSYAKAVAVSVEVLIRYFSQAANSKSGESVLYLGDRAAFNLGVLHGLILPENHPDYDLAIAHYWLKRAAKSDDRYISDVAKDTRGFMRP